MKKYLSWLPNVLTLSNLLMGCVSIKFALNGNLADATYFILIALVFDFFDGFAARLLNAHSLIGKDLDSLADMVSFGVAPSMLLYGLASHANFDNWAWGNPEWVGYLSFLIAIASAYRLAKFNNDTKQSYGFIGLPTPANALIVVGLVWMAADTDSFLAEKLTSPYAIIAIIAACCWLPLNNLHFIALKFKNFSWKDNSSKYILVIGSALLFAMFKFSGLFYIVCFYILLSVAMAMFSKPEDDVAV
jgi:CDP-diacylglycerol--serine O-phosphatidyltransferase